MKQQVLTPCMQDADEANLCAKSLWIRSHFQHDGSAGPEQPGNK
jgi:hypothetical protein